MTIRHLIQNRGRETMWMPQEAEEVQDVIRVLEVSRCRLELVARHVLATEEVAQAGSLYGC